MLGPSILVACAPISAGYAFNTWRQAKASVPARAALAIAGIELLVVLWLIAVTVLTAATG
jgi:hypothetical protein